MSEDLVGVVVVFAVLAVMLVGILALRADKQTEVDTAEQPEVEATAARLSSDSSSRWVLGILATIGGFVGMVGAANLDVSNGGVANIDLVGWRGILFTSAAVAFLTGIIQLAVARVVEELRKRD
ncbi:hypothetical protein [Novosphingobium huizhouense]|uniref:hypothetical protein n=1 Tax=Novosphingobium huizhouense TaxID=2866625 RepID=UPI001CD8FA96|nr:hypothetical protein [Novosphingobium huizhouense]